MSLPGANNGFYIQPSQPIVQPQQPVQSPGITGSISQALAPAYDTSQFMGFTIPGEQPGQMSNTINLNTVDLGGIDGLIGKFGPAPDLLKRREYLVNQQKASATQPKTTEEQIQAEALKRSGGILQGKLDQAYSDAATYGGNLIDNKFAGDRSKAISEEAALGRLRSPVSLTEGSAIPTVDRNRSNAYATLYSGLAGQRAGAQTDIAKTIESLLAGERRAGEQVNQFGQSMDRAKSNDRYGQLQDVTANSQRADAANLQSRLAQPEYDLAGDISKWLDVGQKGLNFMLGPAAPSGGGSSVFGGGKKPAGIDPKDAAAAMFAL